MLDEVLPQTLATAIPLDLTTYQAFDEHNEKPSDASLRELFQQHPFCLTNSQGRFVYLSPRYLDFYGYTAQELLGQACWNLAPKAYSQTIRQLYKTDFETSSANAVCFTVQRKNGMLMAIIANVFKLKSPEAPTLQLTFVQPYLG